ncbi:hypothetical protein GCM10025858_06720 [Alicyclobacillus sacchari]|uniref:NAD(P)/FAD-dependent oxidoreductase n=1 Tax=Alicyclobacillus sacchari TaxID=392010 RepID=UPI0023EA4C27|nr:FAD-dependent oxidoreductase [Alicyclobacillus sacchari]GMA56169.1 hypothetical protein GCM10025858_06720 [Alicyclobacillus sacchari]
MSAICASLSAAPLTGIELMGELLDYLPKLCKSLNIPWEKVDLQCIEAMPTILPMVAEHLRPFVVETYTKKGGKLRTNTKINEVTEGVIHLDGGETVEAGTIIWTGGVRANPLLSESGFTVDRRGRAKVNEFMQSVDDEVIFIAVTVHGLKMRMVGHIRRLRRTLNKWAHWLRKTSFCASVVARWSRSIHAIGAHSARLGQKWVSAALWAYLSKGSWAHWRRKVARQSTFGNLAVCAW